MIYLTLKKDINFDGLHQNVIYKLTDTVIVNDILEGYLNESYRDSYPIALFDIKNKKQLDNVLIEVLKTVEIINNK